MSRAFLSLYVVIAVSILVVGWGIDKLWQAYNPEPSVSEFERGLLTLLGKEISSAPETQVLARIASLNENSDLELSHYLLDELASSSLGKEIATGKIVSLYDAEGKKILYQLVPQKNIVLAVKAKQALVRNNKIHALFMVAFYLILAVAVYFWIWPLSRDLRILQKQTKNIGDMGIAGKVELRAGSNVQDLADAFNVMTDRLTELLTARKEMTYAVSHELRTPLARMKFALEMLGEKAADESLQSELNAVREDVTTLDTFVSEFLAYASFDQENGRLELKSDDFYSMCQAFVSRMKAEYPQKDIVLQTEGQEHQVVCDWLLMERVLSNLLENALRYAKDKVILTLARAPDAYIIVIEDNGPGIPADQRERAFQSFVRLSGNAQGVKKGYGLGLAIVKRIILWHKGNIVIEDSALGGAKFIITLNLGSIQAK